MVVRTNTSYKYSNLLPVPGDTWEERGEAILRNSLSLELHGFILPESEKFETFLFNYFMKYNPAFKVDQLDMYGCPRPHSHLNDFRSLIDIYLICRTYYPKCSLEDVHSQLVTLLDQDVIKSDFDTDSGRRVYKANIVKPENKGGYSLGRAFEDEFGMTEIDHLRTMNQLEPA